MSSINFATREISCKVVYYGPGLSGKTTNLQVIHQKMPQDKRTDMVSLATEGDRTLFFDFLPLNLGEIKGFKTRFQLYTVPGQAGKIPVFEKDSPFGIFEDRRHIGCGKKFPISNT